MDRDESGEVIERANMSLMDRVISFTASFIDVAPTGYHEGKIRETTVLLVKRALWHEARAGFGPEQFDRWCTQDAVSADRLRRAGFRLDRMAVFIFGNLDENKDSNLIQAIKGHPNALNSDWLTELKQMLENAEFADANQGNNEDWSMPNQSANRLDSTRAGAETQFGPNVSNIEAGKNFTGGPTNRPEENIAEKTDELRRPDTKGLTRNQTGENPDHIHREQGVKTRQDQVYEERVNQHHNNPYRSMNQPQERTYKGGMTLDHYHGAAPPTKANQDCQHREPENQIRDFGDAELSFGRRNISMQSEISDAFRGLQWSTAIMPAIDKLSSSNNPRAWFDNFDRICYGMGWGDPSYDGLKAARAQIYFTGEAERIWKSLNGSCRTSYRELKEEMILQLTPENARHTALSEFYQLKQRDDEKVEEFCHRIKSTAKRAGDLDEPTKVLQYLYGLRTEIRTQLSVIRPDTIEYALFLAKRVESLFEPRGEQGSISAIGQKQHQPDKTTDNKKYSCWHCGDKSHLLRDCESYRRDKANIVCNRCQDRGHIARVCPKSKNRDKVTSPGRE
jgi:hypothetical protein